MEDYLNLYNSQILDSIDDESNTNVNDLLESYFDEWKKRLKKYLKYLKRTFNVVVTDYLPSHILGVTDCQGNIWMRRLYGYVKEQVLRHEIIHNLFPYLNELAVRSLTATGYLKDKLTDFHFIYR